MAFIYQYYIFRGAISAIYGLAFWTTNPALSTMDNSQSCHWCEMGFFKKSPLHADSCFYKSRSPKRKFEEVEPQRERIVVKLRRVISPNLWGLPACWAPDVWEVVTN